MGTRSRESHKGYAEAGFGRMGGSVPRLRLDRGEGEMFLSAWTVANTIHWCRCWDNGCALGGQSDDRGTTP